MIIAEIGQAHDGSLGMAHSYIDALAETGIDTIKFQMHYADYESSSLEKFRIKFSYEDKTRYDYWKRMEFSLEQWVELKNHCEDKNIEFLVTPFSLKAVDFLEKINVGKYKIGSGDTNNHLLLKKVAETSKPIILSTGMASFSEIDESIKLITKFNNKISLLQCTSKYPVEPQDWGLNVIEELKLKYKFPIGYSDHSGNISAVMAATALGADIVEFHVCFDHMMFGPDTSSSLTINEVRLLAEGVKQIRLSLNNPVNKSDLKGLEQNRKLFSRTIVVNKDLKKGHRIDFDDLEAVKPGGNGLGPTEFNNIIGKKLTCNKRSFSFVDEEDLC